jgi:hypothetical protein
MSDKESRVKHLLSNAKQYEYYASCTSGETYLYWKNKADNTRYEALNVPDNYKQPEFVMPEWGTYGT